MEDTEAVSAAIRAVGAQVRAAHHTVGVVRTLPGDVNQLDCACGVVLTNGPGWSLDEHLRMHRAEAKYEALLAVAHPQMPLRRPSAAHAALDAALAGNTSAVRGHLAHLDDAGLEALAAAARDVLDAIGTGVSGEALDDDGAWAPGFPSTGRIGTAGTREQVEAQVTAWNTKVEAGAETLVAAVYHRADGGEWQEV